MPIDPERLVGATFEGAPFSWAEEDVVLYNLAVGAGDPPDAAAELKYAYEGELVAVPAFGTIPPFGIFMSVFTADEALEIDLSRVLHGDQDLTVHGPIPTAGTVIQRGRIVDVYDRGKGALIVGEVVSVLEESGEPLFTNRSGVYVRGEGGFGGDSGPRPDNAAPERAPDHSVESPTLPQQALLYRMASGDKNPLHADPAFAELAGYERPILHGLCTYGVVSKALVETVLEGDPSRLGRFTARFTGHVFPGETLVTRIWDEGDRHVLETWSEERGTRVLGNAAVTVRV